MAKPRKTERPVIKTKKEILIFNTGTQITSKGAEKFLDLVDTPGSYSGQAGKVLIVNDSETGLIFGTAGGGAQYLDDLIDVDTTGVEHGMILKYDATDNKWRVAEDKADKFYEQTFDNATTVEVNHNMNKYPAVVIMDNGGRALVADITYIDLNTVKVEFDEPQSGKVVCN